MTARAAIVVVALSAAVAVDVAAAVPPLELAQKSLAKQRADDKQVTFDLRVTQMSSTLHEFALRGTFAYGARPAALQAEDAPALRLLWIALLANDPVAELQRGADHFIDATAASISVQDEFVLVYGTSPSIAVSRDFARVVAITTRDGAHRWVVRLTWRDGKVATAMVTRDGQTVLTARANQPRSQLR